MQIQKNTAASSTRTVERRCWAIAVVLAVTDVLGGGGGVGRRRLCWEWRRRLGGSGAGVGDGDWAGAVAERMEAASIGAEAEY
jgi:hypothetical protein